ncbi:alkaline phosphatase D family protein, partial [Pelolinea submarina]
MYTKRVSFKGSLLVSNAIRIVVVLAMLLSTFSINLGSVQAATNNKASTESRISPGMITSDDPGDGEETPEEVSAAEEEPTEESTEEPPLLPIEEPTVEPTEEILEEPTVEPTEEDSAATPVINVSVNSLSSFSSSPGILSEVQTYMVSGSGLSEDLNIAAPNDFLISFDDVTFDSNLTLPQIDGSVAETIIYVRFNPAEVGISDGAISHASSGADDVLVAVSGTAGYPVITATSSMTAFNQIVGSPSEEQTYIVAGNFLTSDVVVTAPEDFEISKTTGEGFDSILTFSPTDGALADSVIFVRLNAASAKEYEASIVHTSEGAEDVQLAVSGLAEDELITAQATTITFTGEELLGCPTDSSIKINIVPDSTIEYRYQYGTSSGAYSDTTSTYTATGGAPHEIVINGLTENTKYYYRMQYHIPGETDWVNRTEHSFWTQRAEGSTFAFSVTSDIHDNKTTNMQNAMTNIYNKQPDFEIDLGDTFMLDNLTSQSAVNNKYLAYREAALFDKIGNSTPIFLSSGNHENEEGWNLDDTFSIALASIQARKAYYPTPIEDGFYSANTDTLSAINETTYGDEYREDYYAWTWGDALFVVIDPFQYTMELPYNPMAGEGTDDSKTGDQWSWTLGAEQFQWLKETLENSDAKYKFMFSHQMVGGIPDESVSGGAGYVRGGAEASAYFEWGGKNANGSEGFADERDPIDFGSTPMHQFMVENGVSAYFHGHDHQYVYEKTDDGIVYQEVPSLGMSGFGGIYEEGDHGTFETIKILPSPAHLLITVSPSMTTVDYIPDSSTSGEATYSYTILPSSEDTTSPTVSIEQAASQADPTSASSVNFDVTFSESVSDFTTGDVTLSGSAGATAAEVSGSGTAYSVEVSGMTTSGTVIADVAAAVAHDTAGNPNLASTSSDNSITFNELTSPGVVELDGTASAETGAANASSVSFSHTTGTGTNRLMLVGTSWNCGSTTRTISSVVFTYGTEELDLVEGITQESNSTAQRFASIWYSPSEPPQNTSGTVTVTFSGSVSNGIVAGAANFAGVNLADPFTVTKGANSASTGTTQSVTLESLNGNELVFDTVFIGASSPPDPTVGDGQTGLWTDTVSNTRGVASIEQAESNTVTMSWTTSSTVVWAIAAMAIN